jgi:hypothetical protein
MNAQYARVEEKNETLNEQQVYPRLLRLSRRDVRVHAAKCPRVHEGDVVLLHGSLERAGVGRVSASGIVVDVVENFPRQLHVIVGKFANLRVVDAEDFRLLGGPQPQAGNHVHDEQDQTRAGKGVQAAAEGVGKLVAHLDPMVIEPTTGNVRRAVQYGDVVGGEECGADVADEAADTVNGEDVEGIINAEQKLELRGVVGKCGAEDTEDDSSPCRDITLILRLVC